MIRPKRIVVPLLVAGLAPFIASFAVVFVAWSCYRGAENFTGPGWLFLFWAPILGAGVGCAALFLLLKRWWRLLVIPYGFAAFWLQVYATYYYAIAFLGEGP